MKAVDYIVLAVLSILVLLAIISIRKHGHGCQSGCSGCPYSENCNKKN